MTNYSEENLLFQNQYVIGPRCPQTLPSWGKRKFGASLWITSHVDLAITEYKKEEKRIVLIGYMLDPERPLHDNEKILKRLLSENHSFGTLLKSTYGLVGNWVLIYSDGKMSYLFHDCTGLRSVYYTDIEQTNELWLASQPRLLKNILNLQVDKEVKDFIAKSKSQADNFWWPGEESPYTAIKALLPNHYLDLTSSHANRFWPDGPLPNLSRRDAIEKISEQLTGTMTAAVHRFDLALALSAGWDSRVMLAASKTVKDKVCVYNGKRLGFTNKHPDVVIPRRFARKLNLKFHYLPQKKHVDDSFRKVFEINAPHTHDPLLAGLYIQNQYFERQKVGVTGNVLEVARFYYKLCNTEEHRPTGKYLAKLAKMNESKFAIDAFERWLEMAHANFNLNIYDLFYWEQRMGRWFSNNCLVFYMAWKEVLFPFNCRRLLIDLLSVTERDRMPPNYTFYKDLIGHMWPELLSEPINPAPQSNIAVRIVNKLKRMI